MTGGSPRGSRRERSHVRCGREAVMCGREAVKCGREAVRCGREAVMCGRGAVKENPTCGRTHRIEGVGEELSE